MIDANVLDRTGGPADADLDWFLEGARAGRFRVLLSAGVGAELARAPQDVREAARAFETVRPRPQTHNDKLNRIRVRAILRGDTETDRHEADAAHVGEAAEAGCAWFLTNDKRILRRRDDLRQVLPDLRIATVAAFLARVG